MQRPDREGGGLPQQHHPRQSQQGIRHEGGHLLRGRQRGVPGDSAAVCQEHHHRFRPDGRHVGRCGGQPAHLHGRSARHQRFAQGRTFCPLLRRLQHSAGDVSGCAGIPARYGAGVRRCDHAWCQAALRLRRGYGAESDGDTAQILRRLPHRDELQAAARRHELCMADRRNRRYGC